MSNEFRKDDLLNEERLTTSDLAQSGEQRMQRAEIESPAQNSTPATTHVRGAMATGNTPTGATTAAAPARARTEEDLGPLFSADEANNFRGRWDAVQVGFVDEPRQAVEEADRLVAETMKRLAEIFAQERQKLEQQWDRGDNISTEDLRLALRRYRSFFSRLLSV